MTSIFERVPVSVSEQVAHWQAQLASNRLWEEVDRSLIAATIQAIEGKAKDDALQALHDLSYTPTADPTSRGAAFARFFMLDLKYGK